jgi:hypothetical protein
LNWIIKYTEGYFHSDFELFDNLKLNIKNIKSRNLLYEILKSAAKDAQSIVMIEVLFSKLSDEDLIQKLDGIFNSSSSEEKVEIINHLFSKYHERFYHYCKCKIIEESFDYKDSDLSTYYLMRLMYICSSLGLKAKVHKVSKSIINLLKSEKDPDCILFNLSAFISMVFFNEKVDEDTLCLINQIEIVEAAVATINNINDDTALYSILLGLTQNLESEEITFEIDEYEQLDYDTLRIIFNIYSSIINSIQKRFSVLGIDSDKDIKRVAKKLERLEVISQKKLKKRFKNR